MALETRGSAIQYLDSTLIILSIACNVNTENDKADTDPRSEE